ncbi:hypothetical protein EMIT0P43_150145 [Pseudomonas jessenii]
MIGRLAGRLREQARSHNLIGVHQQVIGRLAGRLREQARSYSWAGYTRKKLVGWQATIASKLAPTEEQKAEHPAPPRRFSPLIRPSVSSPAAFDLDPPAPSAG